MPDCFLECDTEPGRKRVVMKLRCAMCVNWASEASPTLGCSIDFRVIYICVSVRRSMCLCVQKCIGGITWPKHAHARSQIWAVKTDI